MEEQPSSSNMGYQWKSWTKWGNTEILRTIEETQDSQERHLSKTVAELQDARWRSYGPNA